MVKRNEEPARREALKIIGAVGATCAFPFSADELYGQHAPMHEALAQIQPAAGPYTPKAFSAAEYQTLARLADRIIPATDTPGAVAAGVPQYIDTVAAANQPLAKRLRAGVQWLDRACGERHGKPFGELSEEQQIAVLTPLCDAADSGRLTTEGDRFFRIVKSMTADGYYTSRAGLLEELQYRGNTALDSYPECTHPEHR